MVQFWNRPNSDRRVISSYMYFIWVSFPRGLQLIQQPSTMTGLEQQSGWEFQNCHRTAGTSDDIIIIIMENTVIYTGNNINYTIV